jgi:hypothetical protein
MEENIEKRREGKRGVDILSSANSQKCKEQTKEISEKTYKRERNDK